MADGERNYLLRIVAEFLNNTKGGIDKFAKDVEKFRQGDEKSEKDHQQKLTKIDVDEEKNRQAELSKLREFAAKQRQKDLRLSTEARQKLERKANEDAIKMDVEREAQRHASAQDAIKIERELSDAIYREIKSTDQAVLKSRDVRNDASREMGRDMDMMSLKARKLVRDLDKMGSAKLRDNVQQWFDHNSDSVAKLDNQLRGLATLAAIGFAQQLLTVLGALAGAFTAAASSAAFAGTAIGAAMTSAAAQAVPAIGLIVATFGRIGAVFDAVKQANKAGVSAASDATAGMEAQRNAANRLTEAHEAVVDADRRVVEARKSVNEAIGESRREMDALADSERAAQQAAEGAFNSLDGARRALRESVQSGDITGFADAELGVRQAETGLSQAVRERDQVSADARRRRAQGVGGAEGVVDARKQLEDSARAAAKARRGLIEAQHDADVVGKKTAAAATNLNNLLAQLSPAEKRLYGALLRLQENYKKAFRPITDILVRAFTRGVDSMSKLVGDPRITKPFTALATSMAGALDRIRGALTSRESIRFFGVMTREAARSQGPIASISISLFKLFRNIAEAGIPAFRIFLRFFERLTAGWAKNSDDRERLSKFFVEGARHAIAWIKLGGAVIRLFAALAGAGGAKTGLDLVKDLTKTANDATESVHRNREAVAGFFEDSREVMHQIGRVLVALGREFANAFDPKGVEALANLLIEVFIPALGKVIIAMGILTKIFEKILTLPLVKDIAQIAIAFGLGSIVISKFVGVIGLFTGGISKLLGPLGVLLTKLGLLQKMKGPGALTGFIDSKKGPQSPLKNAAGEAVGGAGGAAAGAKAGDEAGEGFLKRFKGKLKNLKGLIGGVLGAGAAGAGAGTLGTAAGGAAGGGALAAIAAAAAPIAAIVAAVLAAAGFIYLLIKNFGLLKAAILLVIGPIGWLIGALSLLFKWLGLTEDLPGDIAKAFVSMGKILRRVADDVLDRVVGAFRGIVKYLVRMPGRVLDLVRDVGRAIIRGFARAIDFLSDLPGRFGRLARNAVRAYVRAIEGIGGAVWRAIKGSFNRVFDFLGGLGGRFKSFGKSAADGFLRGIKGAGRIGKEFITWIGDGIKDGIGALGNIGKSLIKTVSRQIDRALPDRFLPDNPLKSAGLYRAGGIAGADVMLSPGEVAVEPGGRTWTVPGRPAAADSVMANVPPGTGILTWSGQVLRGMGASLHEAIANQLPHFASGGFTGFDGSGSGFNPISAALRRLGVTPTDGRRPAGTRTSSGNISDHSYGLAVDYNRAPMRQLDKANAWIKKNLRPAIKQLIWRDKDQYQGFSVPNHMDHVHLALKQAYATNAAKVSALIGGRRSKGGGGSRDDADEPRVRTTSRRVPIMGSLFRSVAASTRGKVTALSRAKTKASGGAIGTFARGVFEDVRSLGGALKQDLATRIRVGTRTITTRSVAGRRGRSESETLGGANAFDRRGSSTLSKDSMRKLLNAVRLPNIFGWIAQAESTLNPNARNRSGASGLFQIMMPLHAGLVRRLGGDVFNMLTNARAAKSLSGGGRNLAPWAASRSVWGRHQGQTFRSGGFVGPQRFQNGGVTAARASANPINEVLRVLGMVGRTTTNFVKNTLRRSRNLSRAINLFFANTVGEGGFFDKFTARMESLRAEVVNKIQRSTFRLSKTGRLIRRSLSPEAIAGKELDLLQKEFRLLLGERGALNTQLRAARTALKKARGNKTATKAAQTVINNILSRIRELNGTIGETVTSIGEAAEQRLADSVEKINDEAQRWLGLLDLRTRGIDLQSTSLDLQGRVADLREAAGDSVGAFAQRGGVLAGRGAVLASRGQSLRERNPILIGQMRALEGALRQARAQGNTTLSWQLFDQLNELAVVTAENNSAIQENAVAMVENTAAIKANISAARAASIERITGRGGFLTGVFGSLGGLLEATASATGTTIDLSLQKNLIEQAVTTLIGTGGALRDKLLEFGVDLRGLGPSALADRLRNINFDQIEAKLSVEDRGQFEGLINSIIENATAVQQNTDSLRQLSSSNAQTFTSTAWQWFRSAIFNGAGGLLPQFSVPGSTGSSFGGVPMSGALGGTSGGNVHASVYVTEQVQDADPDVIANRLGYRLRYGSR